MALTQLQIQLCSQEGQRATRACVKKYRDQHSENINRIRKKYRKENDANWDAYRACQEQVTGGCPPNYSNFTQENIKKCEDCWENYSEKNRTILRDEYNDLEAEDRFLDGKTNQRYDPLGNPLPGCECCDEGRTVEAACRRRGATPIAIPATIVPPPRPRTRNILDDAMPM